MLMLARAVLALFGFMTGWLFFYWAYFIGFDLDGHPFLGRGVPFLIGLALAGFILVATHQMRHGYLSFMVLGAVGLGSLGFLADHVGLTMLANDSLPGLLPVLLLTGPGGFLLGGLVGALSWWAWSRHGAA